MRYIDTGTRDSAQALGAWLETNVLLDALGVNALRWQTGFFGADSLGYFAPVMARLREIDGILRVLVGSNDGATTRSDIERLLALAGAPRRNQEVGIVSYGRGYFHPKTIHLSRTDDSAAAYVGSANLTGSGVTSLHIEAGLLLDTREGDDQLVVEQIAGAVDGWFYANHPGLSVVVVQADLDALVSGGILNDASPSPDLWHRDVSSEKAAGASLSPLLTVPSPTDGMGKSPQDWIVENASDTMIAVPSLSRESERVSEPEARWGKELTPSDAQRKASGNQRGSITLTQAGYAINSRTYFRHDFFASADWTMGATRTGETRELAVVPFEVHFLGTDLGTLEIPVTYAVNREAGQNNYTSLLHLGPLDRYFLEFDVSGCWIELIRYPGASYTLSVS